MKFTKTEIEVMQLFASRILDSFTIREVSRIIKKDLKIVHTSIKNLLSNGFLFKDKDELRINYKDHIQDIAYIENIRKEKFFKKHDLIKIYTNDFIKKSKTKFFVMIIFGSYVAGKEKKDSDVDVLAILPSDSNSFEKQFNSLFSTATKEFHVNVITEDSFKEMLQKRSEVNVANETFNNHIILYGAEQYYNLMGERDVR